MKVQVLIAAVQKNKDDLLQNMNIQSDAIVGNQCEKNEIEEFEYNGHNIKWLSFKERGVGLNRNNALMRADGDICLFADDDMKYLDNYSETVIRAFESCPDADVIIFNLKETVPKRYVIPKKMRVNRINYLRYGTARVAVKLKSVKSNAIYFNQCFGGGTQHCHGEDNLFLTACLDKGLKIYAVPEYIAELTEERESTWNTGYDDKYLQDQGCLYYAISKKWWKLLCLQDAVRRHKSYKKKISESYKIMTKAVDKRK